MVLSTPGSGFRVDDQQFKDVKSSYDEFMPFSQPDVISPIGSSITDVTFHPPGSVQAGWVKGFGAVFLGVDRVGSTSVELFDTSGASLGQFFVPVASGGQHVSFLGVLFPSGTQIGSVRIISGDSAPSSSTADYDNGGTNDVVVMDDWIYGEPNAA